MRQFFLAALVLGLLAACDETTEQTAPQGPTNQQLQPGQQPPPSPQQQ